MDEHHTAHTGNQDNEVHPLSETEETRVLYGALDSFRQYRRAAHYNISHIRRQSFYSLPTKHMDTLASPPFVLPQTFDAVDDAIDSNADIAEAILDVGLASFGIDPDDQSWKGAASANDMDKARSTIRQLYRDWSADGSPERHACFSPILDVLTELFTEMPAQRHRKHVLVPGAGLGRLVFELSKAGYSVEGNEISYHQLLASNYILNCIREAGQHVLSPWALSFSNHRSRANQLQRVLIPDVLPSAALFEADTDMGAEVAVGERMSMSAGDFCVLYKQTEYVNTFDAVTTCFFIDTAPNFINYIETIRHCLAPKGLWINLGPLLWHFESAPTPHESDKQRHTRTHAHDGALHSHSSDPASSENNGIGEAGSFELSEEEVLALIKHYGFEMLKQESAPATGYIQDSQSMLQNVYNPSFWVARKI